MIDLANLWWSFRGIGSICRARSWSEASSRSAPRDFAGQREGEANIGTRLAGLVHLDCDDIGAGHEAAGWNAQGVIGVIPNGVSRVVVVCRICCKAGMAFDFAAIDVNGVGIVVGD